MVSNINNICICGSGLMGSGIALLFSTHGYPVNIYAVEDTEDEVKEKIENNLIFLAEKEVIKKEQIYLSLKNIRVMSNLIDATKNVDMVIECIPEDLQLKKDLMKKLDTITDENVILATNTSVISISEISSNSINKGRILGTHFWNPPYLIPLVEVIRTEYTTEVVVDLVMEIMAKIGKEPIRVNKDVPGFVGNRIQHALWREAVSIVENGIADAKTVDIAIKNSFGMRLPVLGPFENADMVGNDLTYAVQDYILKYLDDSKNASPILKENIEKNKLGFKTEQGFYTWTEAEMNEKRDQLLNHLINLNKL